MYSMNEANTPRNQLLIHEDVLDATDRNDQLQKKLAIVLQQLSAQGRTPIIKSCRHPNQQWLRSPMGGNGGNQFYLWWQRLHQDDHPAIIVRALRDHDDHTPLHPADVPGDYLPVSPQDTANPDAGVVLSPWTPQQDSFAQSAHPVKIITGYPGSGKTSALHEAALRSAPLHILHVTWSEQLALQARLRLAAMAEPGTEITSLTHERLVATLTGAPVPAVTQAERLRHVARALDLAQLPTSRDTTWTAAPHLFHREARIHLFGNPEFDCRDDVLRINEEFASRYTARRAALSADASHVANAFVAIARRIAASPAATAEFLSAYPELVASHMALAALPQGLPDVYADVDAISVDEVQDLTETQFMVILKIAAAVRERHGHDPIVLIAGDEAQTAQPSGFEWKSITALINRHLGPVEQYAADHNLRASAPVIAAISAIDNLYNLLDRAHRPAQRWAPQPDSDIPGAVHVAAAPPDDLNRLVSYVAERDDSILVNVHHDAPDWLDDATHTLSPAQVKGAEHRNVCILGAAALLQHIRNSLARTRQHTLNSEEARYAIDRLRIAASRAAETVVFAENLTDVRTVLEILGRRAYCHPRFVQHALDLDHFNVSDIVYHKVQEIAANADDSAIAWHHVQHLNDIIDEDASTGAQRRLNLLDAACVTLHTCFRIWAQSQPDEIPPESLNVCLRAAEHSPNPHQYRLMSQILYRWATQSDNALQLVNLPEQVDEQWRHIPANTIVEDTDEIAERLDALASSHDTAPLVASLADKAASLFYPNDPELRDQTAHILKNIALLTLINEGDAAAATRIVENGAHLEPEIGASYYILTQDWGNAYDHIQRINDAESRDNAVTALGHRISMTAADHIENGDYRTATEILKQAPAQIHHIPIYCHTLAKSFYFNNDIPDALIYSRRAAEADPDEPAFRIGLAEVLADTGQIQEAITHADAAIALDPAEHHHHLVKGLIYVHEKRHHQARAAFAAGLKACPDYEYFFQTVILNNTIDISQKLYEEEQLTEFLRTINFISAWLDQTFDATPSLLGIAALVRAVHLINETKDKIPSSVVHDTEILPKFERIVRGTIAPNDNMMSDITEIIELWDAHAQGKIPTKYLMPHLRL